MQVSDNFGPIYQSVVLDGTGKGAVSFQATGSNIRLSNIFFNVAPVSPATQIANQAVCRIYKGNIAAGNVILNSNSGSTGANANGNVDLFDGETCYVEWTGGDPGATATATFSGGKIPFGDRLEPSQLEAQEPFAAGDGTIIFPALKSPDYVPGVSGWKLDRVGDAEFNNVQIRGEIRVVDADGRYIWIHNETPGVGAAVEFGLPPTVGLTRTPGYMNMTYDAGSLLGSLNIQSPTINGTPSAFIQMDSYGNFDESGVITASTNNYISGENSTTIYGGAEVDVSFSPGLGTFTVRGTNSTVVFEGSFSRPNATVNVTGSIPSQTTPGTVTTLSVLRDTYGLVSGNSMVASRAGIWDVGALLQYPSQASSTGWRQVYIYVNGAEAIRKRDDVGNTTWNATPVDVFVQYPIELNAGDVVTILAAQTSGVTQALTARSRAWMNLREG